MALKYLLKGTYPKNQDLKGRKFMKKLTSILLACFLFVLTATSALAADSGSASITRASSGRENSSWGYTTLNYGTDGSWGQAVSSTYSGTCYFISAQITSTYSNGLASGPSDFKSKNNVSSVSTSNVYENEAYRQYTAQGVFQDSSSSGLQYATAKSPVFS
jgi:hypothetical protein